MAIVHAICNFEGSFMATQRLAKRLSALKHSRKAQSLKRKERQSRRPQLEHLEDRRVMALAPPVFILPNNGELLNQNDTRTVAPQELTFRFTELNAVDPASIANGIRLQRAGKDGAFGNGNDVTITPGFVGLGSNSREVVMRFTETLPDDTYRVIVVGAGANALRGTNGQPFNAGANFQLDFRLDLGAQVIAIVPMPVTRNASGVLQQARNKVIVYLNNDDLDQASATNPNFYRLYVSRNTLDPNDDQEFLPTQVEYDAAADTVTLTFGQVASLEQLGLFGTDDGSPDPAKSFRLRIGTDETPRPMTVTTRLASNPGTTFATAHNIGTTLTTGVQGGGAQFAQAIEPGAGFSLPVQPWTGDGTEPGHRDIQAENHLIFGPDSQLGIRTYFYNFRTDIGVIPDGSGGTQPAFNLISEAQRQRAREVFDLYSRYLGVQFVETANSGLIVATGDLRVIDPDVPTGPGGVAGLAVPGSIAIMDNAELWNDSYGGNWFDVAMHEIGHMLGLGHSYDLPPHTIQGEDGGLIFNSPGAEPVFPGDHDIVHGRVLYRPESKDIDMYRFVLDGTGVFTVETFAERLPNSSGLDTHLTLWRENANGTRELIANNDDYFSKDSHIQLTLGPGTYFVGVSASGNNAYNPTIEDSGIGGTTQGHYEVKFDFRKSASNSIVDRISPTGIIADTLNVPFDGDADGRPGGVYNFWFRAAAPRGTESVGRARTLFVDKSAPAGGNGSLGQPYNNIQTALQNAREYDIVRIVGNGGADGNINTLNDNLAYRIGFDDFGSALPDGASLNVPKNVTVMVDAGAIFQMRRSQVSVGSTSPSIAADRSGGALQVLGTPTSRVFFTSYNERGPSSIGLDQNPLNVPPSPGDWGGLSFKNDLDRADGRFEHQNVGVFLNYVNHADIRFGGGQVNVNSVFEVITPIHMTDARPTISQNIITRSADAAMSANPDSFEESNFQAPRYWPGYSNVASYNPSGVASPAPSASFSLDYQRVGPDIHGNRVINNTVNGLFVRTTTPAGNVLEELTVAGRFDDVDIVHVIQENLVIRGNPGGPVLAQATQDHAPPTTLVVPSIVTPPASTPGFFGSAAATVEYKLVYLDLLGNESLASQTIVVNVPAGSSGRAVQLANLPIPSGEFVGRRLYRRINGSGEFTLVDQVPAQVTTYVDRNVPRSGELQRLRVLSSTIQRPRLDASLTIDPLIIAKLDGARIDVGVGAQLLAEGQDGLEVIFTSLNDDRYGAGGTFDTPNDNLDAEPGVPQPGDWGGIFYWADSTGSIEHSVIAFAGGLNRVEGTFTGFNAIEVHQADVRIARNFFEKNAAGTGGQAPASRFGRGFNDEGTIFVRGAQPVIIENIVLDNQSAFININVNAMNSDRVIDLGRQTGLANRRRGHLENQGPLIRDNRLDRNSTNGMIVRGGTLTTEVIWDDTDIVHVLLNAINVPDFHAFGGMRLKSSATESLVVKALGSTAGITATGRPLEIEDRIGGIIQILGQPGFPVIMTSLNDDTVGAGFTPDGRPQTDTNGDSSGGGGGGLPTGPEVNNGTLIDNDVPVAIPGHFEVRPGSGGSIGVTVANSQSGVTVQGQTGLFINQEFIFEFLNYVDVGGNGSAVDLSTTTVTMPPTLISNDLVRSEGTFQGANGVVTWRAETHLNNGEGIVYNTLNFSSAQPLGNLRYINYLDEDVFAFTDDLLWQVGTPGAPDFRLYTLDNAERVGFSQGGVYAPGTGLVNATYDGWTADKFADLRTAIEGGGTTYSVAGNIDLVDLPSFFDPDLGTVHGLADVTTAMAWTVNPQATSATITTFLELVAENPTSAGSAGDWQGITIDQYAHDRNVATILEQESATGDGTANAIPEVAQVLGSLAQHEKGSDENLRLGFTVHGLINSLADVDVYSFSARSGTEIWIDIDRTWHALDPVVELIDNLGNVVARSISSPTESLGDGTPSNIGRRMQKTPPFEGMDYYTTNPRDPGMRLVLPGPGTSLNTYHVRVRANPASFAGEVGNTLNPGLTTGAYQLQIRLREVDEIGGSTVQYANIAYATNGIRVLGHPQHSPLAGEHIEINEVANNVIGGAQNVGNLLNTDRGALSIGGNIAGLTDVDWYRMEINYDAIQSIAGFGGEEQWFSTIFDLDYADGLARPNTSIYVFDSNGNLVYIGRDSNVADDRPGPLSAADMSDLSRGSAGAADPWIGPVEVRVGEYFVAVSNDSVMPALLNQYTQANATNPLMRLEPVNSIRRIVEDRVGADGSSNIPVAPDRGNGQFVNLQQVVPWNLQDVTLFVTQDGDVANSTRLLTVDPFSGTVETTITRFGVHTGDIAMHPRGRLYTFSLNLEGAGAGGFDDNLVGNYYQIDTGTGAATLIGDDTIETYEQDPTNAQLAPVRANPLPGGNRVGEGIHFRAIDIGYHPGNSVPGGTDYAGLAIGGRDPFPNANDPRNIPRNDYPNILYAFNQETGEASSVFSGNRTGNQVLNGAATQIVERGILNTLLDVTPPVSANSMTVTEATLVSGATTFQILDFGYPVGRPEIPSNFPSPTTFRVQQGFNNRLFEFDAGPEAIFRIDPNVDQMQIRDGDGFEVNGNPSPGSTTFLEFDTGQVLIVAGAATFTNFPVGSRINITDVNPDPLGPNTRAPQQLIFEFSADGVTTSDPANPNIIPILTGDNAPAGVMTDRIVATINAAQATHGFTTQAERLPGTGRVSLVNFQDPANPPANPLLFHNSDSTINFTNIPATGATLQGGLGVGQNNIRIRIEETSVQADLHQTFAFANQAQILPFSTVRGVSGAANGFNRITAGFDGTRINFSGATDFDDVDFAFGSVFTPLGSLGGTVSLGNPVSVPFLAEDDAQGIADRVLEALSRAGFAGASANVDPGSGEVFIAISNGIVVSADSPLRTAAEAPGGLLTGIASINGRVWTVSDTGALFEILNPFSSGGATLDYVNTATDLLGIEFASLAAGPRHVEGGRYQNLLFGIDTDGTLYAFNTQGQLQNIFVSAYNPATGQVEPQSSVETGLASVTGLAFSNLDYNLWHTTINRENDPGHGINEHLDGSRRAEEGDTSFYFGFENVTRNNVGSVQQYAPQVPAGQTGVNNYDFPGGAHGSIETTTFSLLGYGRDDNPMLYFNYYLETEGAGHNPNTPVFMRDSFRVFVGGDDGVWHLLGTNNGNRFVPNPETPPNDEIDYAELRVREMWDNTDTWRQARIPLRDFAGQDNLRLRFDFSTAGSMNVGNHSLLNGQANTPTNGDELRAVAGHYLRDGHTFTLTAPGDSNNPTRTFEIDLGYTLNAPNGRVIPDGARFTINGVGFEFDLNGSVTPGFRAVPYTLLDTAQQVAQSMQAAILAAPAASPVQLFGNRLNLRGGVPGAVAGATNVTATNLPAGFIEGAPGVASGNIAVSVHSGMSREDVREAIALVFANVYGGGNRNQIKTHNEMIRLIGFRWVTQGPGPNADPVHQQLLGITTALPGDEFGAFNASSLANGNTNNNFPGALRGQANAFEGVYIDDIIIAATDRGEMVTAGGGSTIFVDNPQASPQNIPAGNYQLEMRRGPDYAIPTGDDVIPDLILIRTFETNDRFTPSRTLVAPRGIEVFDALTFSLSDGINTLTFEFNDLTIPGSGVTQGNVRIDYSPLDTAQQIAQRVARAINSSQVQAVLKIAAQIGDGSSVPLSGFSTSTSSHVNLIGSVSVPETGGLNFQINQPELNPERGDTNRFRDQGQIILNGNEVRHSSQWGILIDSGARSAADGNTPHSGPVRHLREINDARLVPGVVVMNNVIHNNGTGGILYSGDPATDNSRLRPFGRIVNNTLYGQGGNLTGGTQNDTGIRVEQNAAPTLMNNIIANFNQGVFVDASSQGFTVLGGMVFQGNDNNSNIGLGGDFPIALSNSEPLFVNAAQGNFYLAAQSRAIDSSVDSLLDRPQLITVKSPLGILPSPILSPDRDGWGQLRVDDPEVSTPQGFGLNPFKDRGAIDRVDFTGPSSVLINPEDNDALGNDIDPSSTVVVIPNQTLFDFSIRLVDRFDPNAPAEGSDIEDSTVTGSTVRVEVLTDNGPVLLQQGEDYNFAYDATSNIIRLTPTGGVWPLSQTYRITLNNSPANGIKDRAGNLLLPNQLNGTHTYTIFLGTAEDWGDLPDSYGTTAANNGPSHTIEAGVFLGSSVGAAPDGRPSPNADADPADDGIEFVRLQPAGPADSSLIFVTASINGVLDAWFDLNQNGQFDANEYILQNRPVQQGRHLVSFTLPEGLLGTSFARFRFTTQGIDSPHGPAPNGEVEDYQILLIGPEFQNNPVATDVNNDGNTTPLDALIVINFLNAWRPLVGNNAIPLPPTSPPFPPNQLPTTDPTGGGVAGLGRFIDVDGNGLLTPLDALIVINFLRDQLAAGQGEGEAEGEAAPSATAFADTAALPATQTTTPSIPAVLLASTSIVIEERSSRSDSGLADPSWLMDEGDDFALTLLEEGQRRSLSAAGVGLLNAEELQGVGRLESSEWEDLLDDLADDVDRLNRQPHQLA
jgi:hypothetical protein